MPTPTIPERDEELEKFIDHTIDCTSFDVDTSAARRGVWGYSNNVVAEMLSKVAAFSARRAREKAIEDCQVALARVKGVDFRIAAEKLEKLKSKPQ
jgi:hypothetical protein